MTTTLFILQICLAVLITIIVLLQKSSSIGLGAYSGSNESVFGAKGPAGFLSKFTMFLALLFVLNTIALSYSYNKASQKSVFDSLPKQETQGKPSQDSAPQAPAAPNAPASSNAQGSSGDSAGSAFVVDENAAPSAPLAPSTQIPESKK